jgi:hypothetical protein
MSSAVKATFSDRFHAPSSGMIKFAVLTTCHNTTSFNFHYCCLPGEAVANPLGSRNFCRRFREVG